MIISDVSRKVLEEKVDKGGQDFNNALAELATSLGKHGMKGSLKLEFVVVLNAGEFGEYATLKRSTDLKF